MEDIEDPVNIIGISDLVNKKHSNSKLDLYAIEKDTVGSSGVKPMKAVDPVIEFKNTLKELSRDTGINLENEYSESDRNSTRSSRSVSGSELESASESDSEIDRKTKTVKSRSRLSRRLNLKSKLSRRSTNRSNSGSEYESVSGSGSKSGSDYGSEYGSGSDYGSGYGSGSEYGPGSVLEDEEDNTYKKDKNKYLYRNEEPYQEEVPAPRHFKYGITKPKSHIMDRHPSERKSHSDKQYTNRQYSDRHQSYGYNDPYRNHKNNEYLDKALDTYSGTKEINEKQEDEEDTKAILLDDIDELKDELLKEDIDLSRIPNLNKDSSITDIKKVHSILKRRYTKTRCNSLGSEIIMAGAQGLEYIFNGQRRIMGYTPDLTGYSQTLRVKLRRLRYETSTIVSDIMDNYNISPMGRVLLEIIPGAFIYSSAKKAQSQRSNYSPDQLSTAFDDLRQFD